MVELIMCENCKERLAKRMGKGYVWKEEVKVNHSGRYIPPKEGHCVFCGDKDDDYLWLN